MLENIKMLLGISPLDTDLDNKLTLLINNTIARLKRKLGGIEPPEDMDDIILEVVIKRFNRIGSEGVSSHTVEGESVTYTDKDFDEFSGEIQSFLDDQKGSSRGKAIYFQRITSGEYDPNTANYNSDSITETKRFANISTTGEETLNLIFGEIKQGALTVRIQNHFTEPFDRIRIGDKTYRVDHSRKLERLQTFIVSEVQNNAGITN